MLKPIPLKVLRDTAVHAPVVQGTRGRTYTPDKSLSRILIQNKKVRTEVDGNIIVTSGALLFFDNANSVGDPTFSIGDRITFTDGNGVSRIKYVKEILEAKTTDGDIHHFEVMLL